MSNSTIALYYHPDGYTTKSPKLMGRNAAGESFLRGFFAYGTSREFWVQVENRNHAVEFKETASRQGRQERVTAITKDSLPSLAAPGCLYLPGPDIGEQARYRSLFGHGGWSLCGITHTTSSARAMDAIADLITKPTQAWDALICTSNAVRANVQKILEAEAEYLQARLGVSRVVLPQLPMIPLGIMTGDFAFTDLDKARARAEIGAAEQDIVVLFAGRLSFHAKAHPLAMYQALEQAAKTLPPGVKIHLVECGWHANEVLAKSFADAAAFACPSVRCITLDGRKAPDRNRAWACADIFCSLSDNIQETFGLVPIEAMAAGLPVVVSDWDGYKDTVRDGIDGFRIPTIMPPSGTGQDLAARHALDVDTYDMYCGHTCSLISVDVAATTQAFIQLFASKELRWQMGAAGRLRARETYDWKTIIAQYEDLWAQLAELRTRGVAALPKLKNPWPQRMDPFEGFTSYPTRQLEPEMTVSLARHDAVQAFPGLWALHMVNYARNALPDENEMIAVLSQLQAGPSSARNLTAVVPSERRLRVFRSLTFLAKLGLVHFS